VIEAINIYSNSISVMMLFQEEDFPEIESEETEVQNVRLIIPKLKTAIIS
jgi:hypothetical protein